MKKQMSKRKDTSPKIHQNPKIRDTIQIKTVNLTEKQKQLIEVLRDKNTKLVFISGPAGTSKTYTSILAGLHLINDKRVSEMVYIRSAVESSDSKLGFLPGEMDDKMLPYIQPLIDKLEELLPRCDIEKLKAEERIHGAPVNFLRGLNWNAKCIVADEAQNMTRRELITLITRVGEFSKLYVCGDPDQSDINGKSGFASIINLFNDDESRANGIHIFTFDEEDVVRSGLVKFILKKLKKVI
jgi:phosphate starvation-inducible protein PhoH and related proteins